MICFLFILENVKKGARVVRGPSWNDDRCDVGHGCVGTVTHVRCNQVSLS